MGIRRDLRRAGHQVMCMHKNDVVKGEDGKTKHAGLAVGKTLTFRDGTGYVVGADGSVRRAVPKARGK
jgi:hypothetical protein